MIGDADQIRQRVREHIVTPARLAGRTDLVMTAAQAYAVSGMGRKMHNTFPNVCQVLLGKNFLNENGLELVSHTRPCPSSHVTFHYKLLPVSTGSPRPGR